LPCAIKGLNDKDLKAAVAATQDDARRKAAQKKKIFSEGCMGWHP